MADALSLAEAVARCHERPLVAFHPMTEPRPYTHVDREVYRVLLRLAGNVLDARQGEPGVVQDFRDWKRRSWSHAPAVIEYLDALHGALAEMRAQEDGRHARMLASSIEESKHRVAEHAAMRDEHERIVARVEQRYEALQRERDAMLAVARDAYEAWDTDRNSRVGKLLMALLGVRGIRLDLDRTREPVAPEPVRSDPEVPR